MSIWDDKPSFATILIAGTTKSPNNIKTCDKTRANGSYLNGIQCDMVTMRDWVTKHESNYGTLDTVLQDMKYLSKDTVLDRIRKCATKPKHGIKIYYSGHGQTGTGNWCFADGVVSLTEVIKAVRSQAGDIYLYIYADCCYSGNWAQNLKALKGKQRSVFIRAASCPGKVAYDTKEGGMWTLWWTDKKEESELPNFAGCRGDLEMDWKTYSFRTE